MPAGFEVPNIVDNDEGWGPTTVPEHLEGLPYAPFGKGDKVGRISDFVQTGFNKYGGMCTCEDRPASFISLSSECTNADGLSCSHQVGMGSRTSSPVWPSSTSSTTKM